MKKKLIETALAWLGVKEGSEKHKEIVDLYNSQAKLPRGYKVKYTDSWCATFVSACFMKAGISAPLECSCYYMWKQYKEAGQTVQRGMVEPGDIVFYTWDNGKSTHHVGIVEAVDCLGYMTVIEGNKNDEVGKRRIKYDSLSIYAIARPYYAETTSDNELQNDFRYYTVVKGDTLSGIAKQYGVHWRKLWEANPLLVNPNLIRPGMTLKIPRKE